VRAKDIEIGKEYAVCGLGSYDSWRGVRVRIEGVTVSPEGRKVFVVRVLNDRTGKEEKPTDHGWTAQVRFCPTAKPPFEYVESRYVKKPWDEYESELRAHREMEDERRMARDEAEKAVSLCASALEELGVECSVALYGRHASLEIKSGQDGIDALAKVLERLGCA
jgi:hypothetical protein